MNRQESIKKINKLINATKLSIRSTKNELYKEFQKGYLDGLFEALKFLSEGQDE